MDTLRKFLVWFFGSFFMFAVGIAVLIFGWGLEPKSWWWIIGGGIFLRLFAEVMIAAGRA